MDKIVLIFLGRCRKMEGQEDQEEVQEKATGKIKSEQSNRICCAMKLLIAVARRLKFSEEGKEVATSSDNS